MGGPWGAPPRRASRSCIRPRGVRGVRWGWWPQRPELPIPLGAMGNREDKMTIPPLGVGPRPKAHGPHWGGGYTLERLAGGG